MYRLIALVLGYAIGCVQAAYFVGKLHGIDIREHGSKNAGMTNVTRTISKKWGALVFVFDIVKGAVTFIVAAHFFGAVAGIYAVAGAILGHCFPVWLKFRGGKGVACFIALPFLVDWRVGLTALVIGLILFIPTRYISLGSLTYTAVAAVAMIFFGHGIESIALMFAITALIWFMHRENIRRLLAGTERKFLA